MERSQPSIMPAAGYVMSLRLSLLVHGDRHSPPNGVVRHASAYEGPVPTITAKPDRPSLHDQVQEHVAPEDDASSVGGDMPPAGHGHQPMPGWMQRCTPAWLHGVDALLILTVLGAVVGIVLGSLLRLAHLSPMAIELLGFPGEIMLRLLKLLVLPLIACSMVSGVCSLRDSSSGMATLAWCDVIESSTSHSVHRYTFAYYALSTALAVLLGIVLVLVIQPGRGQPLSGGAALGCGLDHVAAPIGSTGPAGPMAAMLGVLRSLFPDNIVAAAVHMNILGVIVFSLLFGVALSSLGMSGCV